MSFPRLLIRIDTPFILYYLAPIAAWIAATLILPSVRTAWVAEDRTTDSGALDTIVGLLMQDWIAHSVVYAILALLVYRLAVKLGARLWTAIQIWGIAFGASVAYGMIDEIYQITLPSRYPSLLDLGYDAAGAAVGATSGWLASDLWHRWRTDRESEAEIPSGFGS